MQLFRYFITTLVSSLLASDAMDSLDSPFTIEINGKAISKLSDSRETRTQAGIAADKDAAVFTLKDGRLQCGGWLLGRWITEDRSFLPKRVYWFKTDVEGETSLVQRVAAEQKGESYVLNFNGGGLTEEEGSVFADMMNESTAEIKLKFQS